ncbi:transglutaminase family protein [Poseidonocella sp. HB161398]|uniref:transglutaminase family protein n=1 Tax=Poseidonocella sp. HB161398 TaxID=2320855 RepID=UPI001107F4DC|nr:transglutaminase family protein [Poseidonocella sp. HB161398]
MTVITIVHVTRYRYGAAVGLGPHRLMLRPRETPDLKLLAYDLEIAPGAVIDWSQDVSGNAVATASFTGVSDALTIRSRATVSLTAPSWPVFPIAASAQSYPFAYAAEDHTDLGALAQPQYPDPSGRFRAWVEEFVMSRPTNTLSLLKDLGNGIAAQFCYQIRESEGTQAPLETLARGWGTCRDFAVLFAEAARALGLGARIVSGYLHDAGSGQLGSAGPGSTHAWAEVFVPGAGWIPFDPTNRAVGSANLVPVAVGRNISQVAPVAGSFSGSSADLLSMDVEVRVEEAGSGAHAGSRPLTAS